MWRDSDCHMGLVAWSSLAERWISQTYLLRVGVNLLAIYFTGNCYEGEEIDHEFWLTNNISKIHFTNFRSLLNIFAIVQAQVRKAGRCLWGHRYKDRRGGLRWQLGQCWGWRWDQCFDRNESDLWKKIYFAFNSSQRMAKIVFRSKNSTSKPCRRLSRTEWCLVRARSLWPCRGVACCRSSYYVRLVQCQARRRRSCCQPAGKMSYLQINQRKIMKILANKHKLHGENFHQLIFTVVHNNLIVHYAFTHYWHLIWGDLLFF